MWKDSEVEDLLFKWEDEDTEDTQHRGSSFFLVIRQHINKKLEEEARVAPVIQGWRTPGRVILFSCLQLFQDNPIGDWDGVFDGKLLCNFASLEHTRLVPICDVMPGESPSYLCFFCKKKKKKYPAVPVLDQFWAPYERSWFVFCLQREQRAFCVHGSLVFESQVRYSGSLFSTLAYWFVYVCLLLLHWLFSLASRESWRLRSLM